ncbi:MAG: hypothetical protein HY595_00255, partial [Candidatus Omnitrophica bacterium]|nr:hypothetical protein [Candidatus Omnitrophota bacterium]
MKRHRSWLQRIALFFEMHWVKMLVIFVLVLSIVWPIVTFSKIDSYQ